MNQFDSEPCSHCDNKIPTGGENNDIHILPVDSKEPNYCFKSLNLVDMGDTLLNGQKIFNTQFDALQVTHCSECRQLISIPQYWVDNDNGRKHFECLSKDKREQFKQGV